MRRRVGRARDVEREEGWIEEGGRGRRGRLAVVDGWRLFSS